MDTTTSVLLTGVIVAIGRWVNDQKLTPRIAVGVVILTLFLSLMGQSQPRLASRFAALILVVAVVGYAPSILTKLGYRVAAADKGRSAR